MFKLNAKFHTEIDFQESKIILAKETEAKILYSVAQMKGFDLKGPNERVRFSFQMKGFDLKKGRD